jgi:hypothetical protein
MIHFVHHSREAGAYVLVLTPDPIAHIDICEDFLRCGYATIGVNVNESCRFLANRDESAGACAERDCGMATNPSKATRLWR